MLLSDSTLQVIYPRFRFKIVMEIGSNEAPVPPHASTTALPNKWHP